jgi:hypothetical protein
VGSRFWACLIAWRLNPVEGSAVPAILRAHAVGEAVIGILLVSCMPVWILTISLPMPPSVTEQTQWALRCAAMVVFQGILSFLIGKAVSSCLRARQRKKPPADR